MARYSDEQVGRVKQGISLVRLVEAKGIVLKPHGKDYIGHCPFHDDKTPSLVVSPHNNLWNCLGACGVGGSVVDWVMKIEGVSFRHAMELLLDGYETSPLAADSKLTKLTTVPKLPCPVSEHADDQKVMRDVLEYYHQTLKQSPEALAYLKSRGLDNGELISTFKLGYANRSLGLRLPFGNRVTGKAIRDQLQRIGLYRDTGREHFNGSIVIPVFADNNSHAHGEVVEVYGRKVRDDLRPGTPKHTYLPGAHRGVWNIVALQASKEIILCEALIDAMSFWVNGFRHVTASYGVNGFTDDHLAAFKQYQIKRVLIAYDRDEAGNAAADKLAEQLSTEGIDCYRVLFPKGMDANEYIQKMQPPQKALELVIKNAQPMLSANKRIQLIEVENIVKEETVFTEPEATTAELIAELSILAADLQPEELPPLPVMASPVPPSPAAPNVIAEAQGDDLSFTFGDRRYRVRGLERNTQRDELRVQVMVQRGEHLHMDKLDLYSHKQRQVFVNQASVELGLKDDVIKKELGQLLLALENEREKQRQEKANAQQQTLNAVTIDSAAKEAALSLLRSGDLLNRILSDFALAGVVGEEANKLTGYLACVSRKLDKPLAVMIQSSSAAGKSSLMDAILALMPEEERVQYSAMTGQSLFYMGETNLKNKILAIAEEEGAHNASYALKLLQSEGVVTIASTGKDEATGNLITKEYKVQGPVMLFLTTTAIDIDEELLNRCLVLSVNESREQTQAIHRIQRQKRTLQGLQNKLEREAIIALHQNAQRLLRPLHIINPYADQLTFLDDKTRTRRDHEKYLTLIDSIALLHQYQRDIKTITSNGKAIEYIEVTLDDIEQANKIAHEVLGRTLDELPPQTRKLLKLIQQMVKDECKAQGIAQRDYRFSRKHIRDYSGWGNTQLKLHCHRLEEMEYLLTHRGGRGQSFEYELLYDSSKESSEHQLMGLMTTEQLYDKKKSGLNKEKSGSSRPQVGGMSGWQNTLPLNDDKEIHQTTTENAKRTSGAVENISSRHSRSNTSSLVAVL
jgi:DNA primase catalytic core